ncbi:hypothetical protein NDR89_11985 [Cupriavidus gilardii]|uniref:Uncharacterized protein n=1 Tax=Cupriavidus gilardii TaxID=82541 RepID=A0ABY4W0G9_9BURK|nr:hypothetical protein [Cupriavidus gilardii]USE80490.1 hypothetical protein NDR89_11985 [Cupriavidus gilardii]
MLAFIGIRRVGAVSLGGVLERRAGAERLVQADAALAWRGDADDDLGAKARTLPASG